MLLRRARTTTSLWSTKHRQRSMPKRPASPLDECLPRRIPPDDPSRVTVTSRAQARSEKFTNKLQFDVVSTGKQASVLVVGCKTFHGSTGILYLVFSRGLGSFSIKGMKPASQLGIPRSVCFIESRACHVTSHSVFKGQYGVR